MGCCDTSKSATAHGMKGRCLKLIRERGSPAVDAHVVTGLCTGLINSEWVMMQGTRKEGKERERKEGGRKRKSMGWSRVGKMVERGHGGW
ncbi:hypothetical protein M0R45_019124 [Rubus argutus]|uniref:Uncharacterized protein n=1 Tax=Rubus argutus TaxID=59490 RepID=A0AAW1X4K4_RUBAR